MTDPDIQVLKKDGVEIRILRKKCISAGTCAVYAPNTFDLDENYIAILKTGQWDKFEKIMAAAKSCSVLAIEVYKDKQKLYPET